MAKSTPYAPLPLRFAGLDNRHDPQDVGSHQTIAANVDLVDNGGIRRRKGYAPTAVTGTALHSVWGSEDTTYGHVMDGGTLYRLDSGLTATAVTAGSMPGATSVAYAEVNDLVACVQSSGVRFTYSTLFHTFVLPPALDGETQFKALTSGLQGGQCAAYHNGVLYIGTGAGVLFTDAHNVGIYDTRDFLLPTPFPVTHLCPVEGGLWVCGAIQSAFFAGDSPDNFVYNAHPGIGVISTTKTLPEDWGLEGEVKIWAALTTDGVYLLHHTGAAKEMTKGAYAPPVATAGSSIMRTINGAKQMIACFTYVSDGDNYTDKPMTIDTLEV